MKEYKNPIFRKAVESLETLMVDASVMSAESALQREQYKQDRFDELETERHLKWQKQYEHLLYTDLPALKAEAERINEAKRAASLNLDGCDKEVFLLSSTDNLTLKDLVLLAKRHPEKHLYLGALLKYAREHGMDDRSPEVLKIQAMANLAKPEVFEDHSAYMSLFNRHINRMRGYESAAFEYSIYKQIEDAGCFTEAENAYFNEQ